jgi:peroxiredoxin
MLFPLHSRTALLIQAELLIAASMIVPSALSQEPTKSPVSSESLIGKKLPDFNLSDLNGKKVRFSNFAGKVILLDFWATWCPDCREVVGHIQEMSARSRDTGLAVVTLSVDTKPETVKNFMEKNTYTFPVLMAAEDTRTVFQVKRIPTVYLVDQSGVVRAMFVEYGMKGVPELESLVKKLLGR